MILRMMNKSEYVFQPIFSVSPEISEALRSFQDTYVDVKNRSARWKNLALYLTWKMDGSNKLYNFV